MKHPRLKTVTISLLVLIQNFGTSSSLEVSFVEYFLSKSSTLPRNPHASLGCA